MDVLLAILSGVPMTVLITVVAFVIGAILGIPLVLMRRSHIGPLRWLAVAFIEILRGIPPVVWLFIIYFGIGADIRGLTPLTAALIGLGVISGAYLAEIYRGGFNAVASGQWEAASALGMRARSTLVDIVGPQVIRQAVPAAATYGIGLLKDSSVVFVIGVSDIVFHANAQSRLTNDAMGPFLLAAAVYVALTIPTAFVARQINAKLQRRGAR